MPSPSGSNRGRTRWPRSPALSPRRSGRAVCPKDGRKIGVIVHHVASVYPMEIQLAQVLAEGKPVTGVTGTPISTR